TFLRLCLSRAQKTLRSFLQQPYSPVHALPATIARPNHKSVVGLLPAAATNDCHHFRMTNHGDASAAP
ncbi:hypothetical protein Hamer_G009397, partial [Homarus americanus]